MSHLTLHQSGSVGNGTVLLLTTRDAARALAISERKLWEMTKRNLIPCVRIGRSVRYSPFDLQAWIESRKDRGLASATVSET